MLTFLHLILYYFWLSLFSVHRYSKTSPANFVTIPSESLVSCHVNNYKLGEHWVRRSDLQTRGLRTFDTIICHVLQAASTFVPQHYFVTGLIQTMSCLSQLVNHLSISPSVEQLPLTSADACLGFNNYPITPTTTLLHTLGLSWLINCIARDDITVAWPAK